MGPNECRLLGKLVFVVTEREDGVDPRLGTPHGGWFASEGREAFGKREDDAGGSNLLGEAAPVGYDGDGSIEHGFHGDPPSRFVPSAGCQ